MSFTMSQGLFFPLTLVLTTSSRPRYTQWNRHIEPNAIQVLNRPKSYSILYVVSNEMKRQTKHAQQNNLLITKFVSWRLHVKDSSKDHHTRKRCRSGHYGQLRQWFVYFSSKENSFFPWQSFVQTTTKVNIKLQYFPTLAIGWFAAF